jgi:hypothetical protein
MQRERRIELRREVESSMARCVCGVMGVIMLHESRPRSNHHVGTKAFEAIIAACGRN